jgi:hypothetical protein
VEAASAAFLQEKDKVTNNKLLRMLLAAKYKRNDLEALTKEDEGDDLEEDDENIDIKRLMKRLEKKKQKSRKKKLNSLIRELREEDDER